MVGDDVVQLARDAHALVEHGSPGVLLALALQLDRLGAQLALARAQRADGRAEYERQGEEGRVVGDLEALVERQPVEQAASVDEHLAPDLAEQQQDERGQHDDGRRDSRWWTTAL